MTRCTQANVTCHSPDECAEQGCSYADIREAMNQPSPLWLAIQKAKKAKKKGRRK